VRIGVAVDDGDGAFWERLGELGEEAEKFGGWRGAMKNSSAM